MEEIGLVEIIDQIKQELHKSQVDTDPIFAITNVEVDIAFTVSRTKDGRLDFKVVSAGMDIATERTQRITITLESLVSLKKMREHMPNRVLYQAMPKLMRGEEE